MHHCLQFFYTFRHILVKFSLKMPVSDSYNGRLDTAPLMLALVLLEVMLAPHTTGLPSSSYYSSY